MILLRWDLTQLAPMMNGILSPARGQGNGEDEKEVLSTVCV